MRAWTFWAPKLVRPNSRQYTASVVPEPERARACQRHLRQWAREGGAAGDLRFVSCATRGLDSFQVACPPYSGKSHLQSLRVQVYKSCLLLGLKYFTRTSYIGLFGASGSALHSPAADAVRGDEDNEEVHGTMDDQLQAESGERGWVGLASPTLQ